MYDDGTINPGGFRASFGGFDPQLVQQVVGSVVTPTPWQQMQAQDPSAAQGMSAMLGRIASPPVAQGGDGAYGIPGQTFDQPDDGGTSRALQIAQGIMTSPFRLLGAGVRGLQSALGAPAAERRDQQDAAASIQDQMILLDRSLTDQQKLAMGYSPQQVAAARAPIVGAQTGGTGAAVGRDTQGMPNPPVKQAGGLDLLTSWLTGDEQRSDAARDGRVAAYQQMMTDAYKRAQIEDVKSTSYTKSMQGWTTGQEGIKAGEEAAQVAPLARSRIGLEGAQSADALAQAGLANTHAGLAGGIAGSEATLRAAQANNLNAEANNAWTYGGLKSQADLAEANARANSLNATANTSWLYGPGQAAADQYEKIANAQRARAAADLDAEKTGRSAAGVTDPSFAMTLAAKAKDPAVQAALYKLAGIQTEAPPGMIGGLKNFLTGAVVPNGSVAGARASLPLQSTTAGVAQQPTPPTPATGTSGSSTLENDPGFKAYLEQAKKENAGADEGMIKAAALRTYPQWLRTHSRR